MFQPLLQHKKGFKRPAAYVILNEIDGSFYIGSTGDIYNRIVMHRYDLTHDRHTSKIFQTSFDNSNKATLSIIISVIFANDREEAFDIEQCLLDKYFGTEKCTNTNQDARSSKGTYPTEEAIEKNRQAQIKRFKNNPMSEETRQKLREANLGKVLSEEHKTKLSEAAKLRGYDPDLLARMSANNVGSKRSEETKRKMSEAAKGKVLSPEHRAKIGLRSKGNTHTLGYKHSEESRERMSQSKEKEVIINGVTYKGIVKACKAIGISKPTMKIRLDSPNYPEYKRLY